MGHFLTGDLKKMPFKKTILIFRVLGTGALYFLLASVEVPTILAEFTGFTTRTKEKKKAPVTVLPLNSLSTV